MKHLLLILLTLIITSACSVNKYVYITPTCNDYILDLQEQGYSKEWARHKALVECGILPVDKEYISIIED